VHRALLNWSLTRASAAGGEAFAARGLTRLERAVPRTARGAALVRALCTDERWAARYLAARTVGRMAPDLIPVEEAWERLLTFADDAHRAVRDGAAFGIAELVAHAPEATEDLERLLGDAATPRAARRAALRSLVLLAVRPETAHAGARLLRLAALAGGGTARGVGAVILGRGIAARDPGRALGIARDWAASDEPELRAQAERALRGPLAGVR
jgi:hypothetical protein